MSLLTSGGRPLKHCFFSKRERKRVRKRERERKREKEKASERELDP
jgi:hypothetical protein